MPFDKLTEDVQNQILLILGLHPTEELKHEATINAVGKFSQAADHASNLLSAARRPMSRDRRLRRDGRTDRSVRWTASLGPYRQVLEEFKESTGHLRALLERFCELKADEYRPRVCSTWRAPARPGSRGRLCGQGAGLRVVPARVTGGLGLALGHPSRHRANSGEFKLSSPKVSFLCEDLKRTIYEGVNFLGRFVYTGPVVNYKSITLHSPRSNAVFSRPRFNNVSSSATIPQSRV